MSVKNCSVYFVCRQSISLFSKFHLIPNSAYIFIYTYICMQTSTENSGVSILQNNNLEKSSLTFKPYRLFGEKL